MTILEQIEKDLGQRTSSSDIADYQFACFNIAKEQKKSPMLVAQDMAKNFKSKIATACASAPGFINFSITDEALLELGNKVLKTKKLPIKKEVPRTIFFDYGGANVAKELHIGHLRSPIIGEALRRVFEALGHKTISCTYLGDWGLQMGLVIAELELAPVNNITLDILNDYYPRASKRKESDKDFKARAEEITKRLQSLEEPFYSIWKNIREVSVNKIKENYAILNCRFDYFNGESNAQPSIEKVIELLKPHTNLDKDCLVMNVKLDTDTGPMPPVILKKGNGGDLYATTDIATIWLRYRDHRPDEYVYVVDNRQDLHFRQVFRAAIQGGLVPNTTKFTHVGYGTINGTDGKPFKTRAGGTIKLEEVIDLATKAATEKARDPKNAQKIGLAALKFADLSNSVKKDYRLDLDKMTSLEGKTGPYLLYTVARINSILQKSDNHNSKLAITRETRSIFSLILKLVDSFASAAANWTLNGIIDATFNLAAEFNNFYATTNIIKGNHQPVARLVKYCIEFALEVLAIDPVEKM